MRYLDKYIMIIEGGFFVGNIHLTKRRDGNAIVKKAIFGRLL
jgi:hypothetical protein